MEDISIVPVEVLLLRVDELLSKYHSGAPRAREGGRDGFLRSPPLPLDMLYNYY